MKARSLWCLLFGLIGVVSAAELTMTSLTVPEFDANGRLMRKLWAESATGPLDNPRLQNGRIDFFASQEMGDEKIGSLDFTDTVYHKAEGIITGSGRVHFISARGQLAGDGYEYHLTTGKLTLKARVSIDFPTGRVTANSGEATVVQLPGVRELSIVRAKLSGEVEATRPGQQTGEVERAQSSEAIYTGADSTLVLTSPVTAWTHGEKVESHFGEMKMAFPLQPGSATAK